MAQDVERNGCFADDAEGHYADEAYNSCTCSARNANDCVCGYDDSNPLHLDIYNEGISMAAQKLLLVVSGQDAGAGVYSCSKLEEVRRWIIAHR